MKVLIFIVMICLGINLSAQNVETDSLKRSLVVNTNDTMRVYILEALSYAYLSSYPDTALRYALQGLDLARQIKFERGVAICTNAIGNVYFNTGDNAKALEMFLEYLSLKQQLKDNNNISVAYYNIAGVYTEAKDYSHALEYLFKAKAEDEKLKDSAAILYDLYSLGSNYVRMGKNDSALYYINQSYELVKRFDDRNMIGAVLNTFGEIYLSLNDIPQATTYYKQSLPFAEEVKDFEVVTANYYGLAKIYKQKGMPDSAIYYAGKAFRIAQAAPFFKQLLETGIFLSDVFKTKKMYDSAFHYQEMSIAVKDSLFNEAQVKKVQDLKFREQQRQQSMEAERIKYHSTIKLFIVLSISLIFFVIVIFLWRANKEKHRANLLLTEQKEKVESTLSQLKLTQAQLIQSEKMASLGELTAGIAHEIQNPLNFVNNFSEVNNELIEELKSEKSKLKSEEQDEILGDIFKNNEKITFHGKRADAIVKGMLQHSRKHTGQKELTDINALCDEYLRLSYHGLRAKDKSLPDGQAGFFAEIKTDFDEAAGKINIVRQDIGRVLLNIFNNAFYAVNEKARLSSANGGYQPIVTVSTKKLNDSTEIIVTDNGNGIQQNIIDKIFQPFFTTKPTGQGTGLGLSLAYDVITKEHNGTIEVESPPATQAGNASEGTRFIIKLPG